MTTNSDHRNQNGVSPPASELAVQKPSSKDFFAVLPDAVLVKVLEIVARQSKADLARVALVNKRYFTHVESLLYKQVNFDGPELHQIFNESLDRRPRRGSVIEDISLNYAPPASDCPTSPRTPHGEAVFYRPDGVARALSTMSNLKVLNISLPAYLAHGIGNLFNGPFDLACLKTCNLYYHSEDGQYWDLQENIHIFAHPTLESLVIRRAKLDYRGFESIERPHETSLKKLHLIECDINDDALSDVVEFPIALEEFVLTHSQDPSLELEESSDDMHDYIAALKSHGASLQTITIDGPTLKGYKPLRMREFEALKTLRINWDYQLFGSTTPKPRLKSVGFPPELETLEFFNEMGTDEVVTDLLVSAIHTRQILARKWEKLVVVANDDGEIPEGIADACKEQDLKLVVIGGAEID